MNLALILKEEVCRMELVNNDSRLLLVATSHINITLISNILVYVNTVFSDSEGLKTYRFHLLEYENAEVHLRREKRLVCSIQFIGWHNQILCSTTTTWLVLPYSG